MKMLFWNVPNLPAKSVVTWNEPDSFGCNFHGKAGNFGVVHPQEARTELMVTSTGPVLVTEKSNSALRSPTLATNSLVIPSKTRLVETARAAGTRAASPVSATSQKARKMAIKAFADRSASSAARQIYSSRICCLQDESPILSENLIAICLGNSRGLWALEEQK